MGKIKLGKEVAEQQLKSICEELYIIDDDKSNSKNLISSLMFGNLEYKDEIFTLKLIKPIKLEKDSINSIKICEPDGVQLRGMSEIKEDDDGVGKAMAVLGEVTGLGLPVINKLKSRDLMVANGVLSLFL